jgi:acetolactate synthase-1/2/3 large subunit
VIDGLLSRIGGGAPADWSSWLDECRRIESEHPIVLPEHRTNPINSYHFVERLEAHSDSRHVFVSDAGSSYYITGQNLRFDSGQRELTSGAYASMGMALPLAIGGAATEPESQMLVVTGDGSIELNIQELRTISQYDLDIKVFVINNGGYASIRDSQDASCGGRYTDDQEVLDFRSVAEAFGLEFTLIERHEDLDRQIPEILSIRGPALIEVLCDTNQEMLLPVRDGASAAGTPEALSKAGS